MPPISDMESVKELMRQEVKAQGGGREGGGKAGKQAHPAMPSSIKQSLAHSDSGHSWSATKPYVWFPVRSFLAVR